MTRGRRAPAPLPARARGASRGCSRAAFVASGCYPNPGYGRRGGRPAPARLLRGPRRRGRSVAASRRSPRGSRRPPGKPGPRLERRAGPGTELIGAGAKQVRRGPARVRVGVPHPGVRALPGGCPDPRARFLALRAFLGFSRFPQTPGRPPLAPPPRRSSRPSPEARCWLSSPQCRASMLLSEAPTPGGKRGPGSPISLSEGLLCPEESGAFSCRWLSIWFG